MAHHTRGGGGSGLNWKARLVILKEKMVLGKLEKWKQKGMVMIRELTSSCGRSLGECHCNERLAFPTVFSDMLVEINLMSLGLAFWSVRKQISDKKTFFLFISSLSSNYLNTQYGSSMHPKYLKNREKKINTKNLCNWLQIFEQPKWNFFWHDCWTFLLRCTARYMVVTALIKTLPTNRDVNGKYMYPLTYNRLWTHTVDNRTGLSWLPSIIEFPSLCWINSYIHLLANRSDQLHLPPPLPLIQP